MRIKWTLLASCIALIGFSLLKTEVDAVDQNYNVTITQGAFSTLAITIDRDDTIKFQNQDNEQRPLRLEPQGFTANVKSKSLAAASEGASAASYTPSFSETQVGVWKYFIVGQEEQGGLLTVLPSVATPTPSVTASASASMTSTPLVTASPTPTILPTATASPTPTFVASPTPATTASPSMTASPIPTMTASPSPTFSPSVRPSATAQVSSSPSPTTTPMPTPVPEGQLPGFSLFRSTQCTAELVGNTVLTERLSAAKLVRGYWEVKKLTSQAGITTAEVELDRVRVQNLFFRTSFFKGDVTYNNVNKLASFQGTSVENVLHAAAQGWCRSSLMY